VSVKSWFVDHKDIVFVLSQEWFVILKILVLSQKWLVERILGLRQEQLVKEYSDMVNQKQLWVERILVQDQQRMNVCMIKKILLCTL